MVSNFKFIDLFAGIGGIRIPFEELGGECVFSSEWDKFSQITYEANFGEVPHGDITKIDEKDIQKFLDRRKPGQSKFVSQRKESDKVEILSGVFENKTTGHPIALNIVNEDHRSKDYSEIAKKFRPGHADIT